MSKNLITTLAGSYSLINNTLCVTIQNRHQTLSSRLTPSQNLPQRHRNPHPMGRQTQRPSRLYSLGSYVRQYGFDPTRLAARAPPLATRRNRRRCRLGSGWKTRHGLCGYLGDKLIISSNRDRRTYHTWSLCGERTKDGGLGAVSGIFHA